MPAINCTKSLSPLSNRTLFGVSPEEYDLGSTLTSGQAFRWVERGGAWEGVIGPRWVRLRQTGQGIEAETAAPTTDWSWLEHYLQTHVSLQAILPTFPDDSPMRESMAACRGLRLLRQDPWECLASFILSSTKQIVQIQQIIRLLCARYGPPLDPSTVHPLDAAFPIAAQIAGVTEDGLRGCKMGFRAPYLLATARRVADGAMDLEALRGMTMEEAEARLLELPGVGEKIAQCVLLFAYDFPRAFPIDVWVRRALVELYFPRRRPSPARLRRFIATHFGPHAGYAQQYLFHYMRTQTERRGPRE